MDAAGVKVSDGILTSVVVPMVTVMILVPSISEHAKKGVWCCPSSVISMLRV